jgi:outer membrane protein OmpA-like peptidoglycan-associated protein
MLFVALAMIALCLNVNSVLAQDRSYEGTITLKPVRLEQQGETLYVDFDIVMEDVKVKSAHGTDFIPQLVSGDVTRNLPRVSVKGKNEYLVYERRLALMSAKEKKNYEAPYAIEKSDGKKSGVIRYRYTLPYKPWMENARLDIQRDECGCGESTLMNVEHVFDEVALERMLEPYVVTPYLSYVEPVVEEIKSRDIQAECSLDFEVGKTDIRPEYMNNPRELAKIRTMIDELKSDADVQVKRLEITGYASPEGTLEANKRLSEGRAMALRNYLAARYDYPLNQYGIVFGGENWDGLVKALDTFEMDYKEEVLDIITNIPIEKGRETKLMQLRGGVPYQFMLKHIFPSLRVAICKVNYDVKNFKLEEAKEVIKKRPQNLSLNEMFVVANSYPKGSQEFIDIFETAARIYPESGIANMNAAAAALSRSDLVSAERYLKRVKADDCLPEYNNAMGVLSLMKGDYESAEKYLKMAEKLGLNAAKSNLEELARKKANIAEIEKKSK